ncbi:MAG: hypothetical protein GX365_01820, partial [Clostridiales bacterium]|nr:hypothetical protein [Clostridiales bacterium]
TETEITTETEEENPSEIIIDIEKTTNWSISILLNKPNQDEIISSMDFNNDEVINVFDLIYLKKHRLGI